MVPPIMAGSPARRVTGSDSPVSALWSTSTVPSTTWPAIGGQGKVRACTLRPGPASLSVHFPASTVVLSACALPPCACGVVGSPGQRLARHLLSGACDKLRQPMAARAGAGSARLAVRRNVRAGRQQHEVARDQRGRVQGLPDPVAPRGRLRPQRRLERAHRIARLRRLVPARRALGARLGVQYACPTLP